MVYILSTALVILLVLIFILRKELVAINLNYNNTQKFLESARKIANEAIQQSTRADEERDRLARYAQQLQTSFDNQLQTITKQLQAEFALQANAIRQDAVQKSKVVNKGFDGETFSPLLQNKWLSKDFRHIGDPIDFLVLAGAELVRSNLQEEIDSIILLEVKTGGSDLNKVQRRIRDAVVAGKVEFALYNPDTKTIRSWSLANPKGKNDSTN